ncbi:MAG: sulfatase-like hydrolase/transferase, partial [Sphingomonadales bacterium]|nr:sulfatase-like hydrolase/transferase [Sphingomonadales bacterium]
AQKAFAARAMEVAAAQLAYQDEQIGRVLDELQRMGELDNTLVAVIEGDNGASAEAGPPGTINELRGMAGGEDEAWMQANTDKLGGLMTYESYPAGWTWAMNTPLRWTKQYASFLGGIRNGMILSWQGHVAHPGAVCGQFAHLNDMAPTILEAAKLPVPDMVLGAKQKPMDGQSLLPSLAGCDAAKPRTQYFEIGGKVGLYHDGWFLSGDDGRMAWQNLPPGGPRAPQMQWGLYDLTKDFSQSTDLAAKEPARLQAMMELWKQEAARNNVFPLDHRFAMARAVSYMRGTSRKHFDFWGKDVSIPSNSEPMLIARSFTLDADLKLDSAAASGVVVALGSHFGGWSLHLDQGHPSFVWARSTDPKEISTVRAEHTLPQGATKLRLRFATAKPGGPATVTLSADGAELARLELPTSIIQPAGNGETLDIGRDLGVTVTDYRTPHGAIEGDIPHVSIDFD